MIASAFLLSAFWASLADEVYTTEGAAINGFDPVAYFMQNKPAKGNARITATYAGATFHFSSQKDRDAFLRDPTRHAPQYGGYCAHGLAVQSRIAAPSLFIHCVKSRMD